MILYKKIENKLENVGQDDMYPTQIVIDTKDLEKIDEDHYMHTPSGIVMLKKGYRLIAEINGFRYLSLHSYDDYQYDKRYEREFYDDQILCRNDKIGFYINEIEDKTLDEGVFVGDGLESRKLYPDEEIQIIENYYFYDGDSEALGFKIDVKGIGQKIELIYGTGWLNFVQMDYEVAKYISRGPLGYAISSYSKKLTRK